MTRHPARRRVCAVVLLVAFCFCSVSFAQENISPRVDASILRGLEFLASRQQPDGSFEQGGPKVALSSLCVLSFLSCGHVPGDGRYGQTVRRGVDYLIEQFPEDGYVGKVDGSRMYGHGIITLTLAEAYGVERNEARRKRIKAALGKAVAVITAAQNVQKDVTHAGGWRYEPNSADSDLSLSGWQVLALRACNNIGLTVQRDSIDRASDYVLKCYRKNEKGFSYQPGQGPSPAMTGVAILDLYLMDKASAPEITEAAASLATMKVNDDTRFAYYSFYYVTHAAFQVGEPTWSKVWEAHSQHLVSRQQEDGGWPQSRSGEEPGRIYATAMSLLTLTIPNRLLPVHQR